MTDLLQNNETSFYLFDIRKARQRVDYLRGLLGPDVQLAYAIKANPFLVKGLLPYVERMEVCSPGECFICDGAGVPAQQTVISGVYKTPSFIEAQIASTEGRIYTVESMTQFSLLRAMAEKYHKKLPILLRLTNDSQFGINESEIEQIVQNRAEYPFLEILGLQYFSGTQKTSLKKFKRELEHLDALLLHLQEDFGFAAEELEYGPGFPVAYFGEELEEETLISSFVQLLRDMQFRGKITLELGRSIAASCGSFFTHIVDMKCNKGQNYLLVDGGMHQIVYYGQYMGMKQPQMSVVGKEEQPPAAAWNICGSLCSMNDIITKQALLPEVRIGDVLRFDNAGAYCVMEGMALFLSRDLPAVYLLEEDGNICQARKTMETYYWNTINN